METFGDTVRRRRLEKGFGLREFAKMVGISPTFLSKVERDEFSPPSETNVIEIARLLSLDADELLAKAGRTRSDLDSIIQKRPKQIAAFLRASRKFTAEEWEELLKKVPSTKK